MKRYQKIFLCTGENFKDGFSIGYCGSSRSLEQWVKELYKDKAEKLLGWELTEKELLQYLYEYAGKRLKKI